MLRIDNFGGKCQSYQGIWSKSILFVYDSGLANILIDSSNSHISRVDFVFPVVDRVLVNKSGRSELIIRALMLMLLFRNIKLLFKVLLYQQGPI